MSKVKVTWLWKGHGHTLIVKCAVLLLLAWNCTSIGLISCSHIHNCRCCGSRFRLGTQTICNSCYGVSRKSISKLAFSALTLLVEWQKRHLAWKKLSGGMLAWLYIWAQICIWPIWCHCHSLSLAPVNPDVYLPGFTFLVLAHLGSPG